ncbi:hypothetical protein [Raineyella sp. W15-4]|uniref:hypothetical protein n=1 Tax=Raineyella sp. W15-4 TaxID=3081651 RepID=UPI0029540022|nr:hypothetical protein [Raineyella sp. W15-4]WOQ18193.1 hypothetical protein R0145_05720 [Raineyella sp. W15-4]
MTATTFTRDTACTYVLNKIRQTFGVQHEFDMPKILDNLAVECPDWNVAGHDTVELINTILRHRVTEPVPGCLDWCTLGPGHIFQSSTNGKREGYHEGTLAIVPSDYEHTPGRVQNEHTEVFIIQDVTTHPDDTITMRAPYVVVTNYDDGSGPSYGRVESLDILIEALKRGREELAKLQPSAS